MRGMPHTLAGSKGRRRPWDLWNDQTLGLLREMCQQQASWDDINAAFPQYGMSTILFGMRTIIYHDYHAALRSGPSASA